MAYYEKRTNSWRAQWQIDGKRKSKSGFSSRKNAEIFEQQQKIEYERTLIGHQEQPVMQILEICDKYLKWAYENKRPKSAKRDKSSFGIWKTFFSEKKILQIRQLNRKALKEFVDWRSKKRTIRGDFPSKRTINLDLMTLRYALDWGAKEEIIPENPIKEINLFKQKKQGLPKYLTEKEIQIVEKECKNEELKQVIEVLVRTGMRSGELCDLKAGNINIEQSQILLHPEQTKAGYARVIPFGSHVKEIIERLIKETKTKKREYLFCTKNNNKQNPDNLIRRFRNLLNALEKKGLLQETKDINIHVLRKTYISQMIMAGVPPVKVMTIVGHRDWSTMQRYLHLAPEYITDNTDVLPF